MQAKKSLPVSKKVYNDITSRIDSALSHAPASACEARMMVDAYLSGAQPESGDAAAMIAFGMVKVELDRAMLRSSRARQRAMARKSAPAPEAKTFAQVEPAPEAPAVDRRVRLSRRERRAFERSINKLRGQALRFRASAAAVAHRSPSMAADTMPPAYPAPSPQG